MRKEFERALKQYSREVVRKFIETGLQRYEPGKRYQDIMNRALDDIERTVRYPPGYKGYTQTVAYRPPEDRV